MIPPAAVEAAARMLAETCDPLGDWDTQPESYRGIYRRRIMPALQAAAPHMQAGEGMNCVDVLKDLKRVRAVRDSAKPGQPVWLLNQGMVIAYESVLGITD